jgi:hypothetical protein
VVTSAAGRLITVLSMTSVTAFILWLLADVITTTADIKGKSFLSVKSPFCLAYFASSFSGIITSHVPTNGDFMDMLSSSDCHIL